MEQFRSVGSIFSERLDRAIFVTYFLGAVVPLAGLAWVANRYALPALERNSLETAGLIALVMGIAALSLTAFVALRRLAQTAVSSASGTQVEASAMPPASGPANDGPHFSSPSVSEPGS